MNTYLNFRDSEQVGSVDPFGFDVFFSGWSWVPPAYWDGDA